MSATSELAHLFRALKAPAAARAMPTLAERAREESWSHERFLEAVLSTEIASRESHGGTSGAACRKADPIEHKLDLCPMAARLTPSVSRPVGSCTLVYSAGSAVL